MRSTTTCILLCSLSRRSSAWQFHRWKKRKLEVFAQAGFYFENWADVEQFCSEYLHALEITDILGAWGVAFTWPEAIGLNPDTFEVNWHWGPRPQGAIDVVTRCKNEGLEKEQISLALQEWYNQDKGIGVSEELTDLVSHK